MRSRSRDSRLGGAPLAAGSSSAGAGARLSRIGIAAFGALLGGVVGGLFVVGVTLALKAGMDFVARQDTWVIIVAPLIGLSVAVLVLYGIGTSATTSAGQKAHAWRTFSPEVARADISADVVNCAGEEERFPWRLAPIRLIAILATVGSGAAMGTEAPAAYLGVAAGDCLGDRGRGWRRILRPAALAGGAAGVAALMAIPLVGTAFMLEIGRRRRAPVSSERLTAALL
ncbi:MAG TPA: chloride channel protein, partial [Polyangia bacterium]|nr:chloride channel protein [Polyangia bacterium]